MNSANNGSAVARSAAMVRLYTLVCGLCLALLLSATVIAQPAKPDPTPPPDPSGTASRSAPSSSATATPDSTATPSTSPSSSATTKPPKKPTETPNKAKARDLFQKGMSLLNQRSWDAALAQFLESYKLYPTRGAGQNAAFCYEKVHRYAKALEMLETLIRKYPKMAPTQRAAIDQTMKNLRENVGTIVLKGVPAAARIVIDGDELGTFPLAKPIVVSAGTHIVRIYKPGYVPYEKRVNVVAKGVTTVNAPMQVLLQGGRLRVLEQTGAVLAVMLDGIRVGKTPWVGAVSAGAHTVVLKGKNNSGTQPASAVVQMYQTTTLTLEAEALECSVRVKPVPAGATVAVDSVTVGRGIWQGRLRTGFHLIEVAAEGFIPARRELTLARGADEVVEVALERDMNSPLWRGQQPDETGHFTLEIDGSFALTPSVGGDIAGECEDPCSRALGLGGVGVLHIGYEFASGFGLGAAGGYLGAIQKVEGRPTQLTPVGKNPNLGSTDDSLRLSGGLVGATASYRFGKQFRTVIRLGVGAFLGSVRDERQGAFRTNSGTAYQTGTVVDTDFAAYLHVTPEARFGIAFADHFELTAGLAAYMLIGLKTPQWSNDQAIMAAEDGQTAFQSEQLSGKFIVLIVPGVGFRYAF